MSNYLKQTSSTANSFNTGLMACVALATISNAAELRVDQRHQEANPIFAAGYASTGNVTAEQHSNFIFSLPTASQDTFEESVGKIFQALAAEQTRLDPSIEKLIFDNLWDLYA